MFIAQKGKITLTFEETLKKIEKYQNFYIAALDADILKVADKIKADLEMHDRLIVATSIYFRTSLITRDTRIKDAGIVSTIW